MTKQEFVGEPSVWGSHRLALYQALEEMKYSGLPVLELGCGDNSTPFLRQYCKDNNLELFSYDFNQEWAEKFGATYVTDWDKDIDWLRHYGVALIDESPGEHRKVSLMNVHSEIIVIHDSEPAGHNASDYQVRNLFKWFKYTKDFESPKPDAWTTALSDSVDVTKFES